MHFARTMLKEEDEARQHSELREDFTAFSAGTLLPHSPRSAGSFPFQGLQLERGKQNSRDVKPSGDTHAGTSHTAKKKLPLQTLPRPPPSSSCPAHPWQLPAGTESKLDTRPNVCTPKG